MDQGTQNGVAGRTPTRGDPRLGRAAFTLDVVSSESFASRTLRREWIVKGVLARGQPCIAGGPKKSCKTSVLIDLAVSLGSGTDFLGNFPVPRPTGVLVISGESGEATIQETARRVCRSKGIDLADLELVHWGFNLPQLGQPDHMEAVRDTIRDLGAEVLIVDPLYLCLMGSERRIDHANLFDVGPLLKSITDACIDVGATPILAHHFRKGRESPFGPPELEDLSFAGIQEFARQWLLLGRREKYAPGSGEHRLWLSVGGSAGHSGEWALDISEGTIGDEFGGRFWRPTIMQSSEARTEARESAQAARERQRAEAEAERDARRDEAERRAIGEAVQALVRLGRKATAKMFRSETGWGQAKADRILARLRSDGFTKECMVPRQTGTKGGEPLVQEYPGFELVDAAGHDQ